ncbi:MAG: patatin-like phospholipase family protein, partial [Chloroflexota bacterium]
MKPFRKHVAIAIDGGGILGTIVCRALAHLEEHLGQPASELFRVAAGTSTGSIISGGIACGLTAERMTELYASLGPVVFRKSLRTLLWPLTRCKYPIEPLRQMLDSYFGGAKMGDLWERSPRHDVVISAFDLTANHTCFIKPWKPQYADWPLSKAVAASCSVPTFFPP